jgi:hypothetical protein
MFFVFLWAQKISECNIDDIGKSKGCKENNNKNAIKINNSIEIKVFFN